MSLKEFDNCSFVKELDKEIKQRSWKFFGNILYYGLFCVAIQYLFSKMIPTCSSVLFVIAFVAILVGQILLFKSQIKRSNQFIHQYFEDNKETIDIQINDVLQTKLKNIASLTNDVLENKEN